MKTIETVVYEYDELSDKAKDTAREWYRAGNHEHDWHSHVAADFEEFLTARGFDNVDTFFSGFSSQGDGACFDFNTIDLEKLFLPVEKAEDERDTYERILAEWLDTYKASVAQLKEFEARADTELYIRNLKNSYANHYYHARTRYIDVEATSENNEADAIAVQQVAAKIIWMLYYELANAFYEQLEREWTWLNSDEQCTDAIKVNEYTFTAEGKRFG